MLNNGPLELSFTERYPLFIGASIRLSITERVGYPLLEVTLYMTLLWVDLA
jgi:hypothetical protein